MIENKPFFSCEEPDNDTILVRLCGEIDHHSAVRVRSELDELIFAKRPKKMIFDMSEIGFMDSSGLGLIMGRYSLIKDFGGSLVLREPTQATMKILKLAGMERIIKIEKGEKKNENR